MQSASEGLTLTQNAASPPPKLLCERSRVRKLVMFDQLDGSMPAQHREFVLCMSAEAERTLSLIELSFALLE